MLSDFYIFGVLKSLQDYLEDTFDFPLVKTPYSTPHFTFQKSFYFSPDLQTVPDGLKRVGLSKQSKFFLLLYNRSSFQIQNYRRFDIQAYSREYLKSLVEAGLIPYNYKGRYRLAEITLRLKPLTNVFRYQYEFEEMFFLDWVGHGSLDISVPLTDEITFDTKIGIKCEPFLEIVKEYPDKKLFSGTFEITFEVPILSLNKEKIGIIKTIRDIIYDWDDSSTLDKETLTP